MTLQKLNDQCGLVKARMRVQTAVLTDSRIQQDSWTEAQLAFPQACNDEFVERWAVCITSENIKSHTCVTGYFLRDFPTFHSLF